jgi:hypothetical protein
VTIRVPAALVENVTWQAEVCGPVLLSVHVVVGVCVFSTKKAPIPLGSTDHVTVPVGCPAWPLRLVSVTVQVVEYGPDAGTVTDVGPQSRLAVVLLSSGLGVGVGVAVGRGVDVLTGVGVGVGV